MCSSGLRGYRSTLGWEVAFVGNFDGKGGGTPLNESNYYETTTLRCRGTPELHTLFPYASQPGGAIKSAINYLNVGPGPGLREGESLRLPGPASI